MITEARLKEFDYQVGFLEDDVGTQGLPTEARLVASARAGRNAPSYTSHVPRNRLSRRVVSPAKRSEIDRKVSGIGCSDVIL